jgi:uncharacterized membrane protein
MGKGRTEAFSDGVFAIAVTLLILEIKVPHGEELSNRGLAAALLGLWPSLLAFLLSFAAILVTWVNHHGLFTLIGRTDRWLLFANGFLLLAVTFLPFPTALLAEHLEGPGANTAAVVYCGANALLNVGFNVLWQTANVRGAIAEEVGPERIRRIGTAYAVAFPIYLAGMILAWFHAGAGVALSSLPWLLWFWLRYPQASRGRDPG